MRKHKEIGKYQWKVVMQVLIIKVTVYIKVLIHRTRGGVNGNVKHSQREAPVLVT